MTRSASRALKLAASLCFLIAVSILVVPPLLLYRCEQNERNAATSLKTLTSAEADFRANDRDWNHVNDFWTADVAGLYYVRPNVEGNPPEIRLIERWVAEADLRPLKPLVPTPVPLHGYYFVALDEDASFTDPESRYYKQDTGGTAPMGKVHNTSKFGFCAFPAKYGVTGRYTFIVNENNTIFRVDTHGIPPTTFPDLYKDWLGPGPSPRTVDLWVLCQNLSWFIAGGLSILGLLMLLSTKVRPQAGSQR